MRTGAADSLLTAAGSALSEAIILIEGEASAPGRAHCQCATPHVYGPGDLLAVESLVHEEPNTRDVRATTHVTLLALPVQAFWAILEGHPRLWRVLARTLSAHLLFTGQGEPSARTGSDPQRTKETSCPEADGPSEFVGLLRAYHQRCGMPSYGRLSQVSWELREPGKGHYALSTSTISAVIRGRRRNLPSWPWVATFVLACQRIAADNFIPVERPEATLEFWYKQFQAAHDSRLRSDHVSAVRAVPIEQVDLNTTDSR
ncbi:Crp/Fnr family transcriptional regulator [Actinocorallia sp. API 0066]|uniref:Crp/Fnr family transcriptional regulator n=1 Tax=Actinocorallia sp. API 0066 TaxID=2896846 RepID=UPI0035ABAFE3